MKNKKAVLKKTGIILASTLCGLIIGGLSYAFIIWIGPFVEYWVPPSEEGANFVKAWLLIFVLVPSVIFMGIWIGTVSNNIERWLAMMAALFCGPIIARTCEYALQPLIEYQPEQLYNMIGLSHIANIAITILCLALAQNYTKSSKPITTIINQPNTIQLQPYIYLLQQFTQGNLSAIGFEAAYIKLYLNDPTQWTNIEFSILDELFAAVDCFCANPALREKNDLDENQLLEAAKKALAKIY